MTVGKGLNTGNRVPGISNHGTNSLVRKNCSDYAVNFGEDTFGVKRLADSGGKAYLSEPGDFRR